MTQGRAAQRQRQQDHAPGLPVPVLAVGGWVVGGSGKTPACLAIASALQARGHRPGIVSRGYGGEVTGHQQPLLLQPNQLGQQSAREAGEEAWLMAWRLQCPVAVHPDRYRAGRALLSAAPHTDVLLLDDGLAQTSLRPSQRLLVVDDRGLGNGRCLPAGPLRATWPPPQASRPAFMLSRGVTPEDLPPVIEIGHEVGGARRSSELRLTASQWCRPCAGDPGEPAGRVAMLQLASTLEEGLHQLRLAPLVWAITGIARPRRFFGQLSDWGLVLDQKIVLPDHAPQLGPALARVLRSTGRVASQVTLLMTEKDAVKFFQEPASQSVAAWWALRMDCQVEPAWLTGLEQSLWPD